MEQVLNKEDSNNLAFDSALEKAIAECLEYERCCDYYDLSKNYKYLKPSSLILNALDYVIESFFFLAMCVLMCVLFILFVVIFALNLTIHFSIKYLIDNVFYKVILSKKDLELFKLYKSKRNSALLKLMKLAARKFLDFKSTENSIH